MIAHVVRELRELEAPQSKRSGRRATKHVLPNAMLPWLWLTSNSCACASSVLMSKSLLVTKRNPSCFGRVHGCCAGAQVRGGREKFAKQRPVQGSQCHIGSVPHETRGVPGSWGDRLTVHVCAVIFGAPAAAQRCGFHSVSVFRAISRSRRPPNRPNGQLPCTTSGHGVHNLNSHMANSNAAVAPVALALANS